MLLKQGSTGPEVIILQAALLAAHFDPNGDDGVFGPDTDEAVRRYQYAHGLTVDGMLFWPDGETARSLDAKPDVPVTIPVALPPAVPAAGITSNFYRSVIAIDSRFTSTARINDVWMLEPVTRAAVAAIIAEAPMPLMVFETFRSQVRQRELFDEGATELSHVGVHGYGLACDLVKNINGKPSWEGDFNFLGPLAKKHGLIWGGDWGNPRVSHSFRDMDHVQRITVSDQARLFAGTWYPDEKYNPYAAKA
jgi:hypothetical protein